MYEMIAVSSRSANSGPLAHSKLSGASNWTHFIHDEVGGALLAEYTLVSGTFTVKCLYTNGLGLISTNREGTKRYFHFDGLGSTWALTAENENVTDNYSYSAFGVTVSATSTNGPSTNPMRFGGRWGYYDDGALGSSSAFLLQGSANYFSANFGVFLSSSPSPIQSKLSMESLSSNLVGLGQRGGIKLKVCDWHGWFACYWQVCKPSGKYPILCFEHSNPYWVKCVCYGTRKGFREPVRWPDWAECVEFCTLLKCAGLLWQLFLECEQQCAMDCLALIKEPWDKKLGRAIPHIGVNPSD
jgi:hypothetical protein